MIVIAGICGRSYGQADTVRPGSGHLRTAWLKPGAKQYLVYFQRPGSSQQLHLSLWLRNSSIVAQQGKRLYVMQQYWYGNDTSGYRAYTSYNRMDDFSPVYHSERNTRGVAAYNWSWQGIQGADTVAANTRASFHLSFDLPNYNWNLDIETFEMLPLAAGKRFAIRFYDAGLDVPKYILYEVTGSERLITFDSRAEDCWILLTESEFQGKKATQRFWISKRSHEFLKEEDSFNGIYRYKVKLPSLAPDILSHF
ncbi:hypothetical protein CK934_12265 [Chitinophaga sp. MD30]|nr:hypothetical protein CK934_12265 [Chitinophaga sp. MD30]